uniref:VWFA domain-containing protein n=1 Tax=Xiphophorus couchianus TaxID=32473 RepID=A0A3B5LHR7_9TELE
YPPSPTPCAPLVLCALWLFAPDKLRRGEHCPVDLFFVLDTSESVALRQKPPNFYIDQIKEFTKRFVDELKEMRHQCDRTLMWNSGALHYSDDVILVRELSDMRTDRQALKNDIDRITYIGKGTFTDCAIKRGLAELLVGGSHYHENKYIVVVTDGHPITGYKEPCGGVQEAANEARQHGVKVFAVAISPDQEDTRLSLIATDQNYRQNFTAADETRSTKMKTIRTIIDMITNETKDVVCFSDNILGEMGRPGMPGEKGDVGAVGNIGDSGPVGYSGMKGDKGQRGLDGIDGRKGEAGFPGLPGCKGAPGSDGQQGETGPKGDPGSYGRKGGKGDPGRNGEPGRPGNYGSQGLPGEPGGAGPTGDKGERGDDVGDITSSQGYNSCSLSCQGEPGPRGEQGREGSTGANGEPVRLKNKFHSTFGFISQGPKGPRGIKGSAGDRGPIGERGVPGERGNGTKGCHGFQGYPGARGDAGEPGTKGTPGPKGDDGDPGDSGRDLVAVSLEVVPYILFSAGTSQLILYDFMCVCFSECKCASVDLVFVVDSSESIGSTNFALAKDFIIAVIGRLIKDHQVKFALNESTVSVVQYSGSDFQEIIKLTTSLHEFKQEVRDMPWKAEATSTGKALEVTMNTMVREMKKENKVVLVLTDGRSDIIRDTSRLDVLCGHGIMVSEVGSLGIKDYSGREPNQEQLQSVKCANDPQPDFPTVLDNFGVLLEDSFLQNITANICQSTTRLNICINFSQSTNILMLMDSSASVGQKNFEISKAFVKRLAERFLTAERERGVVVRVAVGQYSQRSPRLEQPLTNNYTQLASKIEEAQFQNEGTDVLQAMQFAISSLPSRGDASGSRRKLVLFSDGRSQRVTGAVLEKRVREVADAGIEVFVISVGSQVNEANLLTLVSRGQQQDISYGQRHLFRVTDYPSLLRGVFHQTVSRRVSLPQRVN